MVYHGHHHLASCITCLYLFNSSHKDDKQRTIEQQVAEYLWQYLFDSSDTDDKHNKDDKHDRDDKEHATQQFAEYLKDDGWHLGSGCDNKLIIVFSVKERQVSVRINISTAFNKTRSLFARSFLYCKSL